jgi:glycine reductase complex component B subunit alpha and beta
MTRELSRHTTSLSPPPLRLELVDYSIEDIQWGDRTALEGVTLLVDPRDIGHQIEDVTRNVDIRYHVARPGESKRIVHVLDTFLPIDKPTGGHTFPGIDAPAGLVGTGRTVRLKNLLVTMTGQFPHPEAMTPIERPREGVIDMSGAGAKYSYGAEYFHLILELKPDATLSNLGFDQAIRTAGVRIARHLAKVEKIKADPEARVISIGGTRKGSRPKVVLIYQFQGQIPFVRTFYYGEDISKTLPTFVLPNEFFDGAVVSGNYKSERKIPTSLHCKNYFIEELLRRHEEEIDFLGVILSRGYNDSLEQKKKMGLWSARLARNLGAQGAIAMMEGVGNGTIDFMQTVKACEDEGIKTVAVLHEANGPKGYERPLVDHPKEADAMISRGNSAEKLYLPPLATVIGGDDIDLHFKVRHNAREPLFFESTIFFGAFAQMGASGLRAVYED